MGTFVKIVAAFLCILPATPSKADQMTLEWELAFTTARFWEQAENFYITVYADENGGCVVQCTLTRGQGDTFFQKVFYVFLSKNGEEKYSFEVPQNLYMRPIIRTSKNVVFTTVNGEVRGFETITFQKNGQVTRTPTAGIRSNNEVLQLNQVMNSNSSTTDKISYIFSALESSPETNNKAILRKWSIAADNSPKPAPVLFSGVDGSNAIIAWDSAVGTQYQVQKSTDLETWSDVGIPITGTGEQMNYSEANLRNKLYLRVIIP